MRTLAWLVKTLPAQEYTYTMLKFKRKITYQQNLQLDLESGLLKKLYQFKSETNEKQKS